MSLSTTTNPFPEPTYMIRKKFFRIFGAGFQIYDPAGNVVLWSEQKAFKLKEDIRVFGDEGHQQEILTIHARSWLDFAAAYDVTDSRTGEKVGVLKRKGFRSLIKDQWIIMDANDQDIGVIDEDNAFMAVVRRFAPFGEMIPQNFVATVQRQTVCEYRQHFNPVIQKVTIDFSVDSLGLLDRRLGMAAGILLSAIEQRQGSEGVSWSSSS